MKDFKTKNGFFTGNVGIGTTSPNTMLHIQDGDSNTSITSDRLFLLFIARITPL